MNNLITSASLTMSSQEMADLVEKRHDNVKRTIESLVNQGVIVQPQIEDEPGRDSLGRSRTTEVYVFSGERGKRDSIIVVAQLSPEFTARLVDRWQELEQSTSFAQLPDFNNPAAAARAWAEQVEQRQQLAWDNSAKTEALALAAPKVEVHDRIADAEGSVTIRETANTLRMPERKFVLWMLQNDWFYRRAGHKSLLGYADKVKAGYLVLKQTPIRDVHTGEERLSEQVRVTPLGLTVLARRLSAKAQQRDMPAGVLASLMPGGYASRRG